MTRAFIAIELPEHVQAKIFHVFETLNSSGLVSGNFVDKKNIHLTLRFLGENSDDKLRKIMDKLNEIDFKKFDCETGKIGFFPSKDFIRIIWIDLISKNKEIFKLQKLVEDKLEEAGIKKDEKGDREFQSHVTIARIKKIKDKTLFFEKIKKLNIKKQKFIVDKFSLIKSELTRYGPQYKVIENFYLG